MPAKSLKKRKGHHREAKIDFPLSERRKRTNIAGMLRRFFSVNKNVDELVAFIRQHTFLEPLLPETAEALRDFYGEDTRIVLDLVHIPRQPKPSIVMSIESESTASEGCVAMDEFEDRYWREMVMDIMDSVRFDFQSASPRKSLHI